MKHMRAFGLALLLTALLTGVALAAGPMQPPKEIDRSTRFIEEELLCQCGCTMGVAVCDCGTAEEIRKTIASMMKEGKTKDQILASFVDQYGEQVLQAPTKRGFNLSAWLTPFAALLVGLAVLYWLLRTWVFKYRTTAAAADVGAGGAAEQLTEKDQPYLDQINDLLRRHY